MVVISAYDYPLAVRIRIVGYICVSFCHSQLQSLIQEQSLLQQLKLSRGLRGSPQFSFRSMCFQSAPERGSWDYYQPCCPLPYQYVKPKTGFYGFMKRLRNSAESWLSE